MHQLIRWVILPVIGFFLLYKLLTIWYAYRLKRQLENASLPQFKETLGEHYHYKNMFNDTWRYKWKKGWIIVKGNFDANGHLVKEDVFKVFIFRLVTEIRFMF